MDIWECSTCGAKYKIKKITLPARDKDSIECNYCSATIISWNGGVMYSDEEISGPTKEYKKQNFD